MRIFSTIIALLCGVCLVNASNSAMHLVVWGDDGAKVTYALSESPTILFSETTLTIEVRNAKIDYDLNNVDKITYEAIESSKIEELISDESIVNGNFINVSAPSNDCLIAIYDVKGTLVYSRKIPKNEDYFFSLSDLSQGAYIVNINGKTYKLVRK